MAASASRPSPPVQPVVVDGEGVARFRQNRAVRWLVDQLNLAGRSTLNEIDVLGFDREDLRQLVQLLGYSIDHYAELGFATPEHMRVIDRLAGQARRRVPRDPGGKRDSPRKKS